MTFAHVCTIATVVCVLVFAILLVGPAAYAGIYGVASETGGVFLGRRASPVFLALAVLCWTLRDSTDMQVRGAIAATITVAFGGIALTGVWAFFDGTASNMILLAAIGEAALACAFWMFLRR